MQCTIFGDAGDSGPLPLETSANDFERGNRDVFFVNARNVGTIQAIKVRNLRLVGKPETCCAVSGVV